MTPTIANLQSRFNLTFGEASVLLSIANGGTNAEAAAAANIAEQTVKVHFSNVCRKLGEKGGSARVRVSLKAWGCEYERPTMG